MIRHLVTTDYKQMLWKNGAGHTVELARSNGASLDTFDWRISMADVKSSGEFSRFNGMQRILTVLQGPGIQLDIDDSSVHLKTLQSAQFSGDSQTSCALTDGPIRDFNLIYDPGQLHARLQWYLEPSNTEIFSSADLVFIFNHSMAPLDIEVEQQVFQLKQQESLKIEHAILLKKIVMKAGHLRQACLVELTKK